MIIEGIVDINDETKETKTISDKTGNGVGIIDSKCNFVYVEESFADMHGYKISELIGKNVTILQNKK